MLIWSESSGVLLSFALAKSAAGTWSQSPSPFFWITVSLITGSEQGKRKRRALCGGTSCDQDLMDRGGRRDGLCLCVENRLCPHSPNMPWALARLRVELQRDPSQGYDRSSREQIKSALANDLQNQGKQGLRVTYYLVSGWLWDELEEKEFSSTAIATASSSSSLQRRLTRISVPNGGLLR